MGIAASIFLGFRNTQAIERWWEGRKLWGTDANVSRNRGRQSACPSRQLQNQLLQDLKLPNTTTLRQLEQLRSVWIGDLHREGLTGGFGRLQQLFPTPRQHLPHNQS